MKISFAARALPASGTLVVGLLPERALTPAAREVDEATGGALTRALAASRVEGKAREVLELLAPQNLKNSRVLALGLGAIQDLTARTLEELGGELYARLSAAGESEATVVLDALEDAAVAPAEVAARLAYGARLRSYRFDKYRTKEKPEAKPTVKRITFVLEGHSAAKKAFKPLEAVAEGVFMTRNLVSEPANALGPVEFAAEAKTLEALGVEVEILEPKQLRKLGMGALLAVAQGSVREPRVAVMRWNGAKGKGKKTPIAFVGKGVCFDTGGISIKPAGGMEDMKWDMAGAGVVTGLMKALAGRKAAVNAVGVIGLVENMPSGSAYRPGDIVTSMSGQTIEVHNTDAEGRLVLGDILWYTQETYRPEVVIDLATLTGAMIVALGNEMAGIFANDDALADQLLAAGRETGESVWRMPMGEAFDRMINTDAADMKNVGEGRAAGSITAAQFLGRFIQEGTRWVHIDIAGVTWSKRDKPTTPRGGTAFGVRLLDRLVAEHYEG